MELVLAKECRSPISPMKLPRSCSPLLRPFYICTPTINLSHSAPTCFSLSSSSQHCSLPSWSSRRPWSSSRSPSSAQSASSGPRRPCRDPTHLFSAPALCPPPRNPPHPPFTRITTGSPIPAPPSACFPGSGPIPTRTSRSSGSAHPSRSTGAASG